MLMKLTLDLLLIKIIEQMLKERFNIFTSLQINDCGGITAESIEKLLSKNVFSGELDASDVLHAIKFDSLIESGGVCLVRVRYFCLFDKITNKFCTLEAALCDTFGLG